MTNFNQFLRTFAPVFYQSLTKTKTSMKKITNLLSMVLLMLAEGPAAGRAASGDTAGMTTESMERNKHY